MAEYIVPNRAVSNTIIASSPINDNWQTIEDAINANHDLASQVEQKVDITDLGVENGVATLDEDGTLTQTQIPEEVKRHIFEVSSLYEQTTLNAFVGDICVRVDVSKTYVLGQPDPTVFTNWVEISSINAGGEVGGNPCFTDTLYEEEWQDDTDGSYYIYYYPDQHGQGYTKFLLVDIKRADGQDIICHTKISDDGLVKINTDVPFDADVMISNLSGNVKNSDYIPYCVITGPTDIDDLPTLFSRSLHSISLNTSSIITLVDGLYIVRNITDCPILEIPTTLDNGVYILFCDSANIHNDELSELTYINRNDYLGIVSKLPDEGSEGQRCYVAYDKSYQYENGGWKTKAFTPLGEFSFVNEYVQSVTSYPYRNNGINVTATSHVFDHLFGDKIEGFDIYVDNMLRVSEGRCYIDEKLITFHGLNKNPLEPWQEGDGNGSYIHDQQLSFQVTDGNNIYYTDKSSDEDIDDLEEDFEEGEQEPEEEITLNEDEIQYVPENANVYYDEELTQFYKEAEFEEFTYTGESSFVDTTSYGWGYVYLIEGNDKCDIVTSPAKELVLPLSYYAARKIGYFYTDEDNVIYTYKNFNNDCYFVNPIPLTITDGDIGEILPDTVFLNIVSEEGENIDFFVDNVLVNSQYVKNTTLPLNGKVRLSSDNVTVRLLGFRNER